MEPEPVDEVGEPVVRVGHWTAPSTATGCSVVVLPPGSVASGEVRGGAPATREFALLDPRRMVQHVDAIVLSGGSAFGLAAANGVVDWLVEHDRGHPTRVGPVPIVVGMCLFDLGEGVERPDAAAGRAAAEAAVRGDTSSGRVGAGAGATLGKWRGPDHRQPAGLGRATVRSGELQVHAMIAVNALGDIDDGTTVNQVLAGEFEPPVIQETAGENTTIGVVWTNAALDKVQCRLVAESGHDGLGRALMPAHCAGDGDALVVASVGAVAAQVATVRLLAAVAVEQAVRTCQRAESDIA